MDKKYIENQYHLAVLDFQTARSEEAQWEARKTSMDADSESVQGIKTMNRQEKEDQAQIEYLRRWKEKKQKRKKLLEKLRKRGTK